MFLLVLLLHHHGTGFCPRGHKAAAGAPALTFVCRRRTKGSLNWVSYFSFTFPKVPHYLDGLPDSKFEHVTWNQYQYIPRSSPSDQSRVGSWFSHRHSSTSATWAAKPTSGCGLDRWQPIHGNFAGREAKSETKQRDGVTKTHSC